MNSSHLVIVVRGWTTSGERLLFGHPGGEIRSDFLDTLKRELGSPEVWAPDLELDMFSMRSPECLSEDLLRQIDGKLAASPHIEHVVLFGYSSGTLLARRVFCMAHGADNNGEVLHPARPWAHKIDRLVMVSGITRGWEYSSASPALVRFLSPVLLNIAKLVGRWKTPVQKDKPAPLPFIWQIRRGSPFVVTTRIQYVNVMEALRSTPRAAAPLRVHGLPSTIFLLGANDEYVSPADCTEMGPRSEFAFIELQNCNHSQAMHIAGDSAAESDRRLRLLTAVREEVQTIVKMPWAVSADDIDDYSDPMDIAEPATRQGARSKVDHAIIIVHGIRDNGFWTKRVAREIKSLGRENGISVRAPTPTYGYFSMWDFIRPGGREQAAYWFMERYADVKTHFPEAKISFVGHSNGTYIAARAIQICPAIQFEHIVFAGSVVRCDFPWQAFPRQVRAVLNYVGSADLVVACLPGVIERLRLHGFNVGGAGAFGFVSASTEAEAPPAQAVPVRMEEFRYILGSHGAAITEHFWPEIARFALLGQSPAARQPVQRGTATRVFFHHAPPIVLALALAIIVLIFSPWLVGGGLILLFARQEINSLTQVLAGVLLFTCSFALSWTLSRFIRKW